MNLASELERRYANVRAAMAAHDLDALIVSGSEYSGFEGSVTYLSGFQIVHRYAYVVVPADGDAGRSSSRPRRATSASTGRRSSSRSSPTARAPRSPRARRPRAGSASASTASTTS